MPAGSQRNGAGPSRPDDDLLTQRLSRALDAQATDPVDVEALLSGSHRRARTLRTRRVALGTAGVVLVIALPVGVQTIRAGDDTGAAAALSADPSPTVLSTRSARPVPAPETGIGPAASATADLTGPATPPPLTPSPAVAVSPPAAYPIPDTFAFAAADLPAGLTLLSDQGQTIRLPLVHGQACRAPASGDVTAIAGRQWSWGSSGSGTGSGSGLTVTLTITGWASGQGATAFADLVANTGRCVFTAPQRNHSTELNSGVEGWMGTASAPGLQFGRAVVRIGDLLGGVEVQDARGHGAVLSDAQDLATAMARRLTSMPAPS